MRALAREEDLGEEEIGDNEPYDGALAGDTINAVATARGLSNALIEVRQDLIGDRESAESWADRLARIVAPLIQPPEARAPQDWGSRAGGGRKA
jgi:predicted N-formylglutamate amidohydrolase